MKCARIEGSSSTQTVVTLGFIALPAEYFRLTWWRPSFQKSKKCVPSKLGQVVARARDILKPRSDWAKPTPTLAPLPQLIDVWKMEHEKTNWVKKLTARDAYNGYDRLRSACKGNPHVYRVWLELADALAPNGRYAELREEEDALPSFPPLSKACPSDLTQALGEVAKRVQWGHLPAISQYIPANEISLPAEYVVSLGTKPNGVRTVAVRLRESKRLLGVRLLCNEYKRLDQLAPCIEKSVAEIIECATQQALPEDPVISDQQVSLWKWEEWQRALGSMKSFQLNKYRTYHTDLHRPARPFRFQPYRGHQWFLPLIHHSPFSSSGLVLRKLDVSAVNREEVWEASRYLEQQYPTQTVKWFIALLLDDKVAQADVLKESKDGLPVPLFEDDGEFVFIPNVVWRCWNLVCKHGATASRCRREPSRVPVCAAAVDTKEGRVPAVGTNEGPAAG